MWLPGSTSSTKRFLIEGFTAFRRETEQPVHPAACSQITGYSFVAINSHLPFALFTQTIRQEDILSIIDANLQLSLSPLIEWEVSGEVRSRAAPSFPNQPCRGLPD